MTGQTTGNATLATVALIANLVALTLAVAELRQAQRRAAQAAAARTAASHLRAARTQPRPRPQSPAADRQASRATTATGAARGDFPVLASLGRPVASSPGRSRLRLARGPLPPRRAGPGP